MGKVYLVGAGPAGVAYLTVWAKELLATADVLVYDALVAEELLSTVPENCLMVPVGKRGGEVSTSQADIDRCLVSYCQQDYQVVRLKSGDPFIFGRSASEMQALSQAGCDFEVVPGLSSALTVPLWVGIPLTDSQLSRCFAVCSAHEPDALDWPALAKLDTLVVLMGASHLSTIVHRLQQAGRSSACPIAIIRWGGHPQQQLWLGRLETILEQTNSQVLAPAVIVIGEVVALANAWPHESGQSQDNITDQE